MIELDRDTEVRLTDWANEPTHSDLWKDKTKADEDHTEAIDRMDRYIEIMDGGPVVKARLGKSKARPRLVRKSWEWRKPALEDPFLNTQDMFKVKPRTAEDKAAALQNSLMINYFWATKVDRVQLVGSAVDTYGVEGTVVLKDGWYSETAVVDVEVEKPVYATPEQSYEILQRAVESGQMDPAQAQAMMETGEPMQIGTEIVIEQQEKLVENHPTYEVLDNRDVIMDPTCNGIVRDAQFIIHTYELDMSTLMKSKQVVAEDGSVTGIYQNLDAIDFEADNTEPDAYDTESDTTFVFADKARKKIQVYEYWGYWDIDGNGETVPIVATWIGKVMVRMEKSPYAHNELPFAVAAYMPVKGSLYGEPDSELLAENQESIGKMTRAAHDITATQAIGQRLINEQFFSSSSQWDAFKKGNDAKFRADMDPSKAIYQMTVEALPRSIFDMIQMQQADAESITGVKAFASGISGAALGDSATGIRSAMDATSKRELGVLRRLADQLFKDAARRTIINMQAFVGEEETIRITNDEFVSIRREDLQGEFDLVVEISTPEKDNDTAEKLMKMLQTNQANMDPGLQKIFYGDLLRLWKMPDAAKAVEEYEPQPDPAEEEMKQLQLNNMKMEQQKLTMEVALLAKSIEEADSRIAERNSRAAENLQSDTQLKAAKAEVEIAKADKLRSETDEIDRQFVDAQTGVTRQREFEDKEHARLAKMDELAFAHQKEEKKND